MKATRSAIDAAALAPEQHDQPASSGEVGPAPSVSEEEARRLERERQRLERRLELEEGFAAGSDEYRTCKKDGPGRESSRKHSKTAPLVRSGEERRASWRHSQHKLQGLKSLNHGMALQQAPTRLPIRRVGNRRRRSQEELADEARPALPHGTTLPGPDMPQAEHDYNAPENQPATDSLAC